MSAPGPEHPLVVFDGNCDFCRAWIARWRRLTGAAVEYKAFQDLGDRVPNVPREAFAAAVHLIEPGGRVSRGAEAVFRSLAYAPGGGWALALHENVPGFAAVSEWFYRIVAAHRNGSGRVTGWIWGSHLEPPGTAVTSGLFLRALGVIYFGAFLSLWVQVIGLIGRGGIQPAAPMLASVAQRYGAERFYFMPTVFWIGAGDPMLHAVCAAGAATSILLMLGIAPAGGLAFCWLLYLSLSTVSGEFLWFQWDSLLLETGFLAIFLAPLAWRSSVRIDPEPPRLARWLLRWLLFRLMVASAVVKITSGDPTWRHLTALRYHYETQPLPPWTAWFMHHLPGGFQSLSAGFMFAVEGIAPFFLWGPRRVRFAAAAAIASLQILIAATGNYGFFNLLALALCLLVLDDGVWPSRVRFSRDPREGGTWPKWVLRPIALLLFVLSLVPFAGAFHLPLARVPPLGQIYSLSTPFLVSNSYGLFQVMTTSRPEIVLEGSSDGRRWQSYEFRWKPGSLTRRPEFVAPHMPRLDWQMWFAALSDVRSQTWFLRFCERLLQGSPQVSALLERDPFRGRPPRYLRAVVYDYHFTDPASRRAHGTWWRRELRGLYCPVLTLADGHLAPVDSAGFTPPR